MYSLDEDDHYLSLALGTQVYGNVIGVNVSVGPAVRVSKNVVLSLF
jgi:hypothetical protein